MSDPDYRYCVYCGTDCIEYETIVVPHTINCPQSTGLYPVLKRELEPHGFMCTGCSEPFSLGDFYCLKATEDPLIFEVTCIGCMASAIGAHP